MCPQQIIKPKGKGGKEPVEMSIKHASTRASGQNMPTTIFPPFPILPSDLISTLSLDECHLAFNWLALDFFSIYHGVRAYWTLWRLRLCVSVMHTMSSVRDSPTLQPKIVNHALAISEEMEPVTKITRGCEIYIKSSLVYPVRQECTL